MRPATRLALAVAFVLVGVLLALTIDTEPEPPPRQPPPPAVELTPAETPGAPTPTERQRVLDELQDKEAEHFGPAEASRRRAYREQLLDQRPSAAD